MAFKLTSIDFGQGTGSSMKKDSEYDLALKKDPNLPEYIKKRKTLTKGSPEWNANQNKINRAYGKGPIRDVGESNNNKTTSDTSTTTTPTTTQTNKTSIRDKVSTKLETGGKTSKGFDTKTKTGINLFGQKRNVTKFYDPETGKFVGKEVVVTKKDGTKKQYKDRFGKSYDAKTKIVNPGLTQSGGAGKIRMEKGYFGSVDKPKSNIKSFAPINRPERADDLKDPNVTKDEAGKPSIPTYQRVFDSMKTNAEGKKVNPR